MTRKLRPILLLWVFLGIALPSYGEHGSLSSTDRDSWIDFSIYDLVETGVVPAPSKPVTELTNLEVAQLTVKASEIVLAQAGLEGLPPLPGDQAAPPAPPLPGGGGAPPVPPGRALKSVQQLVEEYKGEMTALGENVPFLEERIFELEHINEHLADLQRIYLTRTGTDVFGYSRTYLGSFRGTGWNQYYPGEIYDSIFTMEMILKSVPVPFLLFDIRSRYTQTLGSAQSGNPTLSNFAFDIRWITLTSFTEVASLTAGDFYQHYTPLILWNSEVPVFNFIE